MDVNFHRVRFCGEYAFRFILGSECCEPAGHSQGTWNTQEEQVKTFLDAEIFFFIISSIGKNNYKNLSVYIWVFLIMYSGKAESETDLE